MCGAAYINNGNGYQPVKVSNKLDVIPPNTGSNVKPAKPMELHLEISCSDDFFKFAEESDRKSKAILSAVSRNIKDGDRKIEKCPECGKKLYIQRNRDKVRVHCGGCGIDVTAEVLKEKEENTDGED